jgi:hypothetical protein
MPDEPVRVEVDDEGFPVGVSGGQDVRGGRTRLPLSRHVFDEVRVVMLEHRDHPGLQ